MVIMDRIIIASLLKIHICCYLRCVWRSVPSVGTYGINVECRHTVLVPFHWNTPAVQFKLLPCRFPFSATGLGRHKPNSEAHHASFLLAHMIATGSLYLLNCGIVPIEDPSPEVE